ncbi:MAG: DUF11 domain-containing protein [Anaerolineae bacterium]|nr:DUF11 domain-containing protein [Anaerolineae bacterium]
MKQFSLRPFVFMIVFLGMLLTFVLSRLSIVDGTEQNPVIENQPETIQSPLFFVENIGQAEGATRFQANGLGGSLFFSPEEVLLNLPSQQDGEWLNLKLRFEGANADLEVVGSQQLDATVNYLIGNDSSDWYTGVFTYGAINYRELYSGIDLQFDGVEGTLKGTYTVAPGQSSEVIRWRYEGAERVQLDASTGDLIITLKGDLSMRELKPVAWQSIGDQRINVPVVYQVNSNTVGFDVGEYNPNYPLVLDPTLVYGTYWGGSGYDTAKDVVVDAVGNVYVTGSTGSPNLTLQNPYQDVLQGTNDAYILKLNANHDLVYATYLGSGSSEYVEGIDLDSNGNIYVSGRTTGADFPIVNGHQSIYGGATDGFLIKLNTNGSAILYSTYIGGNEFDSVYDFVVNGSNAYLTGTTWSNNFPLKLPYQATRQSIDAFVARVNTTLIGNSSLVYSTFFGGNGGENGYGIDLDSTGNIYVVGNSDSTNLPVVNAYQPNRGIQYTDAFLAKFNPAGNAVLYATYFGGSQSDLGFDVDVTGVGLATFVGFTDSENLPTTENAYQKEGAVGDSFDAMLAQINTTLSGANSLIYATYYSRNGDERGLKIQVDARGFFYVGGIDTVENYGVSSVILAVISPVGKPLRYSTTMGGGAIDAGPGIALAPDGSLYVVGGTTASDFPTVDPLQNTLGGDQDAFIAQIANPAPSEADLSLTKLADIASVHPSEIVHYTLTVMNNGPDHVANVAITDSLPTGFTLVSHTASLGTFNSANGVWSLPSLNYQQSATLELTLTVNIDHASQTVINTATITNSNLPDPNTANNIASASIEVVARTADLMLAKTVNNISPNPGDTIVFSLAVMNAGPDHANSVTVTEFLPIGLSFSAYTASQGVFNLATGVWSVQSLGVGQAATLELSVLVGNDQDGNTLTNSAVITGSDLQDSNPNNNAAIATVTVGIGEGTEEPAPSTPTSTPSPSLPTATSTPYIPPTATYTPFPPSVPNDYFSGATVIASLPYSGSQDLNGATVSFTDPTFGYPCSISYYTNTVWYEYTPSQNQRIFIDAQGSDYQANAILAVFTGIEGNLTRVGCAPYASQNAIDIQVTTGTTYYIMGGISGWTPATMPTILTLNIHQFETVPNDLFANATSISSLPFSITQNVYSSTTSTTDPSPVCNQWIPANSVWFRYTAPSDQSVLVDLAGSQISVITAVYTGSEGALTEIACNKENSGARLGFRASAGLTYHILVTYHESQPVTSWRTISLNVKAAPLVSNDEPANAIVVNALPFATTQDIFGSTNSPTEPLADCIYYPSQRYANTVWYRYAPTTTQPFHISTVGSNYQTVIGVYTGTVGNLTQVRCEAISYQRLSMVLTGGTTYWIMVGNYIDGNGPVTSSTQLNLSLSTPPVVNDLMQTPQNITTFPYTETRDIYGSTNDLNTDPSACTGGFHDSSLWYTYTPSVDQKIILTTEGSDFGTAISVFTGTPSDQTMLHCTRVSVGFEAQAGMTYWFMVSRASNLENLVDPNTILRLNLQVPSVANDLLGDATEISSLPYSISQDIHGSTITTTDPGQQPHSGGCNSATVYALDYVNTVWYRYASQISGQLILNPTGSDYSLVTHVYTGTPSSLTYYACGFSTFSFQADVGTTYYFKFSYRSSVPVIAPTVLRFSLVPSSVFNDQPPTAQNMTVPFNLTQNVFDATTGGEPFIAACGNPTRTVWYRYTADTVRTLVFDTAGSSYDTTLGFFNSALHELSCIRDSRTDSPQERITINVSPGLTYYIMVGNASQLPPSNPTTLNIQFSEVPSNDNLSAARVIPGTAYDYIDTQDLLLTTRAVDEPNITCSPNGPLGYNATVWYSYSPTSLREVTTEITGVSYYNLLAIFTGTPSSLTQIVCARAVGTNNAARAVFTAEPGLTYYIMAGQDHDAFVNYLLPVRLQMTAVDKPLTPPMPIFPAHNYQTANPQPIFIWSGLSDPVGYEMQLDTQNPPQTTVYTGAIPYYLPVTPLQAEITYHWRVRSVFGGNQFSEWTTPRSVTIATFAMLAPSSLSPVNNFVSSNAQPVFSWGSVQGAVGYEIYLGTSNPPNTLVYSGSSTNFMPISPLQRGTTYYWRVRAYGENSGEFSDWSGTQLLRIAWLESPVPIEPATDTFQSNLQPAFSWNPVANAVLYEVRIGVNNPPQTLVYNGSSTSFTPSVPLLSGSTYYWQVRAKTAAGNASEWSASRRITFISGAGVATTTNYFITMTPTLNWGRVVGATGYEVQVSRSPSFDSLAYTNQVVNPSATTSTLTPGVYYWRVRAIGSAQWSAASSFTVNWP